MKRLLAGLAGLTLLGALAGWFVTAPQPLDQAERAQRLGDPATGARLFHAGGCASCHAAKGAKGDARLALGGGAPLVTPFGSFQPPNISPGPDGIGNWSLAEFDNAMRRGISPDGRHYYPAFPYTSYARMNPATSPICLLISPACLPLPASPPPAISPSRSTSGAGSACGSFCILILRPSWFCLQTPRPM